MLEPAVGRTSSRSLVEHNNNAALLSDLAVLLGCSADLQGRFPDGQRPDVLRADFKNRILFLGDAKHTETPGCALTRFRLRSYFRWLSPIWGAHICIAALCFTNARHRRGWMDRLVELGESSHLTPLTTGCASFGRKFNLVWIAFAPQSPRLCSRRLK